MRFTKYTILQNSLENNKQYIFKKIISFMSVKRDREPTGFNRLKSLIHIYNFFQIYICKYYFNQDLYILN